MKKVIVSISIMALIGLLFLNFIINEIDLFFLNYLINKLFDGRINFQIKIIILPLMFCLGYQFTNLKNPLYCSIYFLIAGLAFSVINSFKLLPIQSLFYLGGSNYYCLFLCLLISSKFKNIKSYYLLYGCLIVVFYSFLFTNISIQTGIVLFDDWLGTFGIKTQSSNIVIISFLPYYSLFLLGQYLDVLLKNKPKKKTLVYYNFEIEKTKN